MDYFALYNMPVTLQPDQQLVKQRFYELSRKYHPDFFSNASADEQAEVLQKSSEVNKAFRIFSDPDETIRYVLLQKKLMEEEEKYQLEPDFLMEMMELNEDARVQDADTIRSKVAAVQRQIYEPVKSIIENYKDDITSKEALLQVKEYYFRKKYLNRILGQLN